MIYFLGYSNYFGKSYSKILVFETILEFDAERITLEINKSVSSKGAASILFSVNGGPVEFNKLDNYFYDLDNDGEENSSTANGKEIRIYNNTWRVKQFVDQHLRTSPVKIVICKAHSGSWGDAHDADYSDASVIYRNSPPVVGEVIAKPYNSIEVVMEAYEVKKILYLDYVDTYYAYCVDVKYDVRDNIPKTKQVDSSGAFVSHLLELLGSGLIGRLDEKDKERIREYRIELGKRSHPGASN